MKNIINLIKILCFCCFSCLSMLECESQTEVLVTRPSYASAFMQKTGAPIALSVGVFCAAISYANESSWQDISCVFGLSCFISASVYRIFSLDRVFLMCNKS